MLNTKQLNVFIPFLILTLIVILGCGESVEDSEATDLLADEDSFSFQELPVGEDGRLIPLDEIPVVTIEKTREDAETVWWRLKANPAPSRGDLVVGVLEYVSRPRFEQPEYYGFTFVSIPEHENASIEMKAVRRHLEVLDFPLSLRVARFRGNGLYVPAWVGIDRSLQNSGDFDEEETTRRAIFFGNPGVPLPAFRLDDGYVVPQGFKFSYYLITESSVLDTAEED